MSKYHYGWKPDVPDFRDHVYTAPYEHVLALPSSVDLRPQCPPVYDQGQLGSCTSQAIAAAIEFDRKKQALSDIMPSRLFIYYNERAMEGTVNSDAGAAIRDGVKSVNRFGVCPESEWPYDISQFMVRPPAQCYTDALKDRALSYQRVQQSLSQMKGCLASGLPFVCGISVYESFESNEVAQTGMVPMPQPGEQLLGGHAVLCVGFNDAKQKFTCRNSWSSSWGDQGYFYLDYQYLLNAGLASDFWTIKTVG
jgi:C1A family cysteine protease